MHSDAFGTSALRISNGQTSGGFSDGTFTPRTVNAAGETGADDTGSDPGTLQNVYIGSFTIGNALPGVSQPGLNMAVSPDQGSGARMGSLAMIAVIPRKAVVRGSISCGVITSLSSRKRPLLHQGETP